MRVLSVLLACILLVFAVPSAIGLTGEPQPKLPLTSLTIGNTSLTAEVADDDAERERGMMFRKEMGENDGMLFVMPSPGPAAFWMRNTSIPLSIAYINGVGMILEIHDLQPFDETSAESSFPTIAYAIEVPRGWFSKNKILPGDMVRGLPPLTGK